MSAEREREYVELHAFLDYYSTHVLEIDPTNPIHPTNVGKRIVAEYGRSTALEGLKQAVNDTVEHLNDKSAEFVQCMDEKLREQGIVTFSEVRRRYSSSFKRILKRGKLKTETEYYIIAGVLADCSSLASDDERVVLNQLVADFQ
jgi:hypothetical protein